MLEPSLKESESNGNGNTTSDAPGNGNATNGDMTVNNNNNNNGKDNDNAETNSDTKMEDSNGTEKVRPAKQTLRDRITSHSAYSNTVFIPFFTTQGETCNSKNPLWVSFFRNMIEFSPSSGGFWDDSLRGLEYVPFQTWMCTLSCSGQS